ncbi:hypothetical protein GCM10010503_37740 [Streptomyces lucensis JCM 4490]|uniref:Transposase n=1 Tax=Streptomyces lucensis JCM 4490 TaxID=1306176 RepID=A0A918J7P2_9ACTN|nr:hypothetical protein GCM10010503_37740 [Streptomyces lucensis JCM 4490]
MQAGGDLAAADEAGPPEWILDALAAEAMRLGIRIGRRQVRRVLLAEGVRWRRTGPGPVRKTQSSREKDEDHAVMAKFREGLDRCRRVITRLFSWGSRYRELGADMAGISRRGLLRGGVVVGAAAVVGGGSGIGGAGLRGHQPVRFG